MVKTFEQQEVNNIAVSQLALNPGDLSGNLVRGGTIQEFASTGIKDSATKTSLVVEDDKITVKTIRTESLEGNVAVRGDVKIYGVLDAGLIRTTEIIANQRYEKQFLEFANPAGSPVGTGFLWTGGQYNKQFIVKENPDSFFSTENLDMPADRSYMINGVPVVSSEELGRGVTVSNLQHLGTLKKLTVNGAVNIADHVYFNPASQRVSIGTEESSALFTVYDYINDVELVLNSTDKYGQFGTYNTKGVQVITDNQSRITVEVNGDVTVGHEQKDSTVTRVYGKLSVGVKNPKEQFEVAGNIRWANKLFAVGNRAPEEGNYNQGDTIWNSNPKPGAYIGWVCVVSGNPGQWAPFGIIA